MNKVSLKRTYFRSVAILILSMVLVFDFRSALQPIPSLSLLNILAHERAAEYLTIGAIFDLVYFVVVVLALHFVWAYLITISCAPWFEKLRNDNQRTIFWLIIVVLHLFLVLALNSYLYPTSLLSIFRNTGFASLWFILPLTLALTSLFYFGLIKRQRNIQILVYSVAFLFLLTPPVFFDNPDKDKEQPDVILIGLDGLRPDHLQYSRQHLADKMPTLNRFLKDTVIYDRSYTTLPRTFVAWHSLLKSQYPHQHGGRFNIPHPTLVDKNIAPLNLLKQHGYHTIYALDERRFNHIDTDYGFDTVVGPAIGIGDQLITGVSDIPIINILTNLSFGRYFFPFLYLNRAQGKTYDPIMFNEEVINTLSPDKPNFLALHLCMLHWPYTSKDFIEVKNDLWNNNYPYFMYASLLQRLDSQFEQLITELERQGYLDNALVYLFSDHGDGFRLDKDALKPAKLPPPMELRVSSWGHGTNILDQTQSEILLAYNAFKNGEPVHPGVTLNGLFSITDIMPSILNTLDMSSPAASESMQGHVLPMTQSEVSENRAIFVDSSLPSKAVDTSQVNETSIIYRSMEHYEVTDEGHLVMSPKAYKEFSQQKQRSVYIDNWQLAYIPTIKDMVIVNIEKKQWHLYSQFPDELLKQRLMSMLCHHYQSLDIHFCEPPQHQTNLTSQ
ncbi:sulfatase-like hydrolase/transferase [Thalassotalea sp. PS06]|uniref:sulfatase-like hydrolase/transferase n=1 Tax=Thalassotalea sp. PS06 TaxID=2594005 RepID=UPI0011627A32|nr:sulfatase-like hydrolase/transferase [Thalassotalea sp. PS06]QDP02074.1 sulfatase-like hydrolase/transferase [Thalassotalea sp. PS06]